MTEVQKYGKIAESENQNSINAIFKQIDTLTKKSGFLDQHFLFVALNSSFTIARELGSKTGLDFLHNSDVLGSYIRYCQGNCSADNSERFEEESFNFSDDDLHDKSDIESESGGEEINQSYQNKNKQSASTKNMQGGKIVTRKSPAGSVLIQNEMKCVPSAIAGDSKLGEDANKNSVCSSGGQKVKEMQNTVENSVTNDHQKKTASKREINKTKGKEVQTDSPEKATGDHTYDTTSAGSKISEESEKLGKQDKKIQVLVVPPGVDPNEYLKGEEGRKKLRKIVDEARSKKSNDSTIKVNEPRVVHVKLSDESPLKKEGDNMASKSARKRQQKEKPLFTCEICSKSFQRPGFLKKHRHTCSKDSNTVFMCEICGTCCKDKRGLRVHRNRHIFRDRFPCPHCDKSFFDKKDRDNHIRTHTKEKPYVCEVCNKSYSHKQPLRIHMMRHQNIGVRHPGAKVYTCPVCSKVFFKSSSLQEHLRIHVGSKPYSCKVCGKEFRMRQHVKAHLRGIHHMINSEHDSNIAYNKTKVTVIESNPSDSQLFDENDSNQNPIITLEVETDSGPANSGGVNPQVSKPMPTYVNEVQENIETVVSNSEHEEVVVMQEEEGVSNEGAAMEVSTVDSEVIDTVTQVVKTEQEEEAVQTVVLNNDPEGNGTIEEVAEQTFTGPDGTYRLVQDTSVADNDKVYFRVMLI